VSSSDWPVRPALGGALVSCSRYSYADFERSNESGVLVIVRAGFARELRRTSLGALTCILDRRKGSQRFVQYSRVLRGTLFGLPTIGRQSLLCPRAKSKQFTSIVARHDNRFCNRRDSESTAVPTALLSGCWLHSIFKDRAAVLQRDPCSTFLE
jgi:hypothetical protein